MNKSKISDHKRVKKELITPWNYLMGDKLELRSWYKERCPEYLWLVGIVDKYGRKEGLKLCYHIIEYIVNNSLKVDSLALSNIIKLNNSNLYDFINNKEINFKNFSEKQLQFLGIAKVEDFSAYEKDILYYNYADIEKEYSEYETYFSRQENFNGTFYYHITEHRKTKINHEKAKQSDYLAITDYNYTDSNTKFSPEKYVNILIPNQKKIDDYVLNNIDPVYSYCCSAECKQKLIESSGAEKKKKELFEKNIKSINEKIAKFLKAKRKKFIIGAAAVAGWFLLLGILIGMSKDSFDYWDKTQYANNSYPCYEFATFANKDGVFYHTENKKYAISLAYVENPIEVPDEVTEDTYVYLYSMTSNNIPNSLSVTAAEDVVKIYNISVTPGATGISAVGQSDETQTDTWCDLSGRKLQTASTKGGIYIHNGKKFVVR